MLLDTQELGEVLNAIYIHDIFQAGTQLLHVVFMRDVLLIFELLQHCLYGFFRFHEQLPQLFSFRRCNAVIHLYYYTPLLLSLICSLDNFKFHILYLIYLSNIILSMITPALIFVFLFTFIFMKSLDKTLITIREKTSYRIGATKSSFSNNLRRNTIGQNVSLINLDKRQRKSLNRVHTKSHQNGSDSSTQNQTVIQAAKKLFKKLSQANWKVQQKQKSCDPFQDILEFKSALQDQIEMQFRKYLVMLKNLYRKVDKQTKIVLFCVRSSKKMTLSNNLFYLGDPILCDKTYLYFIFSIKQQFQDSMDNNIKVIYQLNSNLKKMMKKQFVSLQQTLNFLQFINTDKQAFSDKKYSPIQPSNDIKIKPILKKSHKQLLSSSKFELKNDILESPTHRGESDEGVVGRKTINKNRAIKRIIDTSKEILQQAYKYQEPPPEGKKSYITQFNIYLKQYNRLGEQILAQEQSRQQNLREDIDQEEAKLQNVYSYTVSQDFRDLIHASIFKDKINKTNVDMIMETFKECLVILRANQIRIHESQDDNSPFRDIKLHEIQNVDYFSQPYIFTSMTIIKDKSAGQQFLYFKFDCPQKQHKWDRALYCNYMVRKMKRKNKFFLYQFPEKEDEKQINQGREHKIKKRDDIKSYDLDKKKIIKNLTSTKESQKQGSRMGTAGMDTLRDLPSTEKRDGKMERFNTQNPLIFLSPKKQGSIHMMTSKNTDQKQYFQSNIKGTKRKETIQQHPQSQQEIVGPQKPIPKDIFTNIFMSGKQNNNTNVQSPNNKISDRKGSQDIKQSLHTFKNENVININRVNSEVQVDESQTNKQKFQQILNPFTKRKIDLKQKYQNGITVKKPKFFSDKPKLIYLGNEQIQYWDFDPSTMHKSQKKLILFKDLKSYKIKEKPPSIIFQQPNKTLQFIGDLNQLQDIIEWIDIQKKQKQFVLPSVSGVREGADAKINREPQFLL